MLAILQKNEPRIKDEVASWLKGAILRAHEFHVVGLYDIGVSTGVYKPMDAEGYPGKFGHDAEEVKRLLTGPVPYDSFILSTVDGCKEAYEYSCLVHRHDDGLTLYEFTYSGMNILAPFSYTISKSSGGVSLSDLHQDIHNRPLGEILTKSAYGFFSGEFLAPFLKLISCRNVVQQIVRADEDLNRKRIKKGKHPLYEYHVLTIETPNGPQKVDVKWGEQPQYHQRLHFNRGHFKEYTAEKPLFGRHVGTYWWQPHLSGQDKEHFLDKDYKVK